MVVGLDFAACDEAAVDAAVEAAWHCFGHGELNTLVNCCSYEGMHTLLIDTVIHLPNFLSGISIHMGKPN